MRYVFVASYLIPNSRQNIYLTDEQLKSIAAGQFLHDNGSGASGQLELIYIRQKDVSNSLAKIDIYRKVENEVITIGDIEANKAINDARDGPMEKDA